MTTFPGAIDQMLTAQTAAGKPPAFMLAGHNGSGKSTMWYDRLAPTLQIPLVNADRMMMSILPDPGRKGLPTWAQELRDTDEDWMAVAQRGVDAFVLNAMAQKVSFATETVFSHWKPLADGTFESKIDRIREMQAAGYFVVLLFVGLADVGLSIGRVATRVSRGGHAVANEKLIARFPRTQTAVRHAIAIADAAMLVDNSRTEDEAFTVCRVQMGAQCLYDVRDSGDSPSVVRAWLDVVAPLQEASANNPA